MRRALPAIVVAAWLASSGELASQIARVTENRVPVDGKFHLVRDHAFAHYRGSRIQFRGRVVTTGWEPLAGVQVRVRQWDGGKWLSESIGAMTSDDGRFELGDDVCGEGWRLTASAAGFVDATVDGYPRRDRDPDVETIVLSHAARVEGVVVDEATRPIAGAAVHLVRGEERRVDDEGRSPDATTDSQGRFVVANASVGTHRLGVEAEGFADSMDVVSIPVAGRASVQVTLQSEAPLEGTVQAEDGTPVAGAQIRSPRLGRGFWRSAFVTTDASGRFRLGRLRGADGATLTVAAQGFRITSVGLTQRRSIQLSRAPELVVRSTRAGSGTPVEILHVWVRDSSPQGFCGNGEALSWHDGEWDVSLARVEPHVWRALWTFPTFVEMPRISWPGTATVVAADGSVATTAEIDSSRWKEGPRVDVTAEMAPTGRLEGTVIASDGTGAEGVRVNLRRGVLFGKSGVVRCEVTGRGGRFVFDGIGSGTYALALPSSRVQGRAVRSASVSPGAAVVLDPIRLE